MKGVSNSLLIPLGVFVLLVAVLAAGFRLNDPHFLPSQLIDQPFPEFSLQALHDPKRQLSSADITGQVALVNVWATWCPSCLLEHPELMRISREEGIPLYGINYNDDWKRRGAGWCGIRTRLPSVLLMTRASWVSTLGSMARRKPLCWMPGG